MNQKRFKTGNRKCEFFEDEIVYAKDFRNNTNKKTEAIIVKQLSPIMYTIKFNDGYITKRHVNQLIRTQIESNLRRGERDQDNILPSHNKIVIRETNVNENVTNDEYECADQVKNKVKNSAVKLKEKSKVKCYDQNLCRRSERLRAKEFQ